MSLQTISAKDVEKFIEKNNVKIIDIREKYEYQFGHIKNAINIPYAELELKIDPFPYDNELVLYCERGNLSLFLGRELSKSGYNVKSLYGGICAYRGSLVKDWFIMWLLKVKSLYTFTSL